MNKDVQVLIEHTIDKLEETFLYNVRYKSKHYRIRELYYKHKYLICVYDKDVDDDIVRNFEEFMTIVNYNKLELQDVDDKFIKLIDRYEESKNQ